MIICFENFFIKKKCFKEIIRILFFQNFFFEKKIYILKESKRNLFREKRSKIKGIRTKYYKKIKEYIRFFCIIC